LYPPNGLTDSQVITDINKLVEIIKEYEFNKMNEIQQHQYKINKVKSAISNNKFSHIQRRTFANKLSSRKLTPLSTSIMAFNPILLIDIALKDWIAEDINDNIGVVYNDRCYCMKRSYFTMVDKIFVNAILEDCNQRNKLYINMESLGILNSGVLKKSLTKLLTQSSSNKIFKLMDSSMTLSTKPHYIQSIDSYSETIENDKIINKNKFNTIHQIYDDNFINSREMQKIVNKYTYKWDKLANNYLRNGSIEQHFLDKEKITEQQLKDFISLLDETFAIFGLTGNTVILYRGSMERIESGLNPSFISTTTELNVTKDFAKWDLNYIYEFRVEPDVPILSLKSFSSFAKEMEILLPRNLIYTEIGSVSTKKIKNIIIVKVSLPTCTVNHRVLVLSRFANNSSTKTKKTRRKSL
jgi:hypothetical protein